MDVVFHRRDLGLGVEQVRVGVSGDHIAHGRLICHFIDLHIFVYYRADRTVAEFIARLGGYAVHFFREADLSEIPSADCKSAVICHTVDLTGNLEHSKTGDRRGAAKRQILSSPSKENRGIVPLRHGQLRLATSNRQHMISVEYLAF